MINQEFVFVDGPTPSCHASTLIELQDGSILAAWFGGTQEGAADVGIWMARRDSGRWSRAARLIAPPGVPGWNPVLHRRANGEILLFYRLGSSPREWSAYLRRSRDGGTSWTEPELLPAGVQGPVKNKPIEMPGGVLLCGSSHESYQAWASWVDRSPDGGRTWTKHGPIQVPGHPYGIIQPALVTDGEQVIALCRSRGLNRVVRAVSTDLGLTWGPAEPIDLPQNNSGLDAVRLRDGRTVLIYNHTQTGRTPLNLATSLTLGRRWTTGPVLESAPGEYSYPAIIEARDGTIHFTYTWRRQRIRYGTCSPSDLP